MNKSSATKSIAHRCVRNLQVVSASVMTKNSLGDLDTVSIFSICLLKLLTLSQTSLGFYMSAAQVFSVFYLSGELIAIFIKFEVAVCKVFQFRRI